MGIDEDLARLARIVTTAEGLRVADLVRHVRTSLEEDGPFVEILLERADRILVADGGRTCTRILTNEEVDLLLAGDF